MKTQEPRVPCRQLQVVRPRGQVEGERSVGLDASVHATPIRLTHCIHSSTRRGSEAVRRDEHTLHGEGRFQFDNLWFLGGRSGPPGQLELHAEVARGRDDDAAAETKRQPNQSIFVDLGPATARIPNPGAGDGGTVPRIDHSDPGDLGSTQDDGARIHGPFEIEGPRVDQVPCFLGLQRGRASEETTDLEATIRTRSAAVPLHQAEAARDEGEASEPYSSNRCSRLVHGLAAHREARTEFDRRRSFPEPRERRRGPGVVRDDHRRRLRGRQSECHDALVVRNLEAEQLRRIRVSRPEQIEARAAQRRAVRGHREPEVGRRQHCQFHRSLIGGGVLPRRCMVAGLSLQPPVVVVARKGQNGGFRRRRRRQEAAGNLSPHLGRRGGHLELTRGLVG